MYKIVLSNNNVIASKDIKPNRKYYCPFFPQYKRI